MIHVWVRTFSASGYELRTVRLQGDSSVRMLREAVALKYEMRPSWISLKMGSRSLEDDMLLAYYSIDDFAFVNFSLSSTYIRRWNAYKYERRDRLFDKLERHARLVGRAAMMFKELFVHVYYRPGGRGWYDAHLSFKKTTN